MHLPIRLYPRENILHQTRRAERISRSIEADHRHLDRRQMCVAELIRFTGRMQWVGKEKEAIALETVGGEHRGRSAAHRPPAYDERLGLNLRSNTRNDRRESVFETRHRIRAARLLFPVKEVEANDPDSARPQSVGRLNDATVVHVSARAV